MPEVEDEAVPVTPVAMGVVDEVAVEVVVVEAEVAAEVEVTEVEVAAAVTVVAVEVEGMTTMTATTARPLHPSRVLPDADVDDDEPTAFSTTPRCSNN